MKMVILITVLLFTAIGFIFSNLMTPAPGSSSGNGNPAILFVLLLPFILFYLIVFWRGIFRELSNKKKWIIVVAGSSYCASAAMYQRWSFVRYVDEMRKGYKEQFGYVDEEYIQDIAVFLSIHVNNQFFNFNTFIVFVVLSVVIGVLVPLRGVGKNNKGGGVI
ncbi:hypothetical protein [Bacillus mesophilum]|uniref:Uncharacterized protein n=1 Tax=Bacillus mesophilum TaxID=1071718 RepID=A0A7V7RRQ7_9BACI|nr:hypothetical protein [Bacillus mesophilum]KAB2335662.1 hypothetical protein F7732_03570 [Bacillus mesophilum]